MQRRCAAGGGSRIQPCSDSGSRFIRNVIVPLAALKVTLTNGEERYFLTWGRVADPVTPEPLEQLLWNALPGFSLGGEPARVWTFRLSRGAERSPGSEGASVTP